MMKPPLYLLLFTVFGLFGTGFSQEETDLVGSIWYLNENTDLEISAVYNGNEELLYYYVESYYGTEYAESIFNVKGDKLQFYFLDYKPTEGDNYYDEQEMDTVDKALFQVLTLNDSVLTLRPLDVGAVRFLDQIQQQGYTTVGEPERNAKFYNEYWNEVSKAKGKKRTAVINKWKKEHHLFVDEAVFHEENWYTELKDINDYKPLIDSIYYSEMMVNSESKDSVHYQDYKIYSDGSFVMRRHTALRTPNDGIPDVVFEREDEETIEFIPPVVTDVEMEGDSPKDENPAVTEEVYDGYKSDIEYNEIEYVTGSTADGYYKGTFDQQLMIFLNAGFNTYGPSRQTHLSDSTAYSCVYPSCGKRHIRVFYKGTYKDLWIQDFRSPILLYGFFSDISQKEDYFTSFELLDNNTEKFPLTYLAR